MTEVTKEPNKKFELVSDDFIELLIHGKKLYRIRALIDFGNIKAGELGGYIEKEENLSQVGDAWVGNTAKVYGHARVLDDAQVLEDAQVYESACICCDAQVSGGAIVFGNALVADYARVFGDARIMDNAHVYDQASISGYAHVLDRAWVDGNAQASNHAYISSNARVSGNAWVSHGRDVCSFSNIDDTRSTLTAYRTKTGIEFTHQDFCGSPEAFIERIQQRGTTSLAIGEYLHLISFARSRIEYNYPHQKAAV